MLRGNYLYDNVILSNVNKSSKKFHQVEDRDDNRKNLDEI